MLHHSHMTLTPLVFVHAVFREHLFPVLLLNFHLYVVQLGLAVITLLW